MSGGRFSFFHVGDWCPQPECSYKGCRSPGGLSDRPVRGWTGLLLKLRVTRAGGLYLSTTCGVSFIQFSHSVVFYSL